MYISKAFSVVEKSLDIFIYRVMNRKRQIKHTKLRLAIIYIKLKNFILGLYRTNKNKKIAFTTCLVIATFAWLLNALNKPSSYTVVFNISYTSIPHSMGITRETPRQIHAELSGSGYKLFFLMLGINNDFEISLNRFIRNHSHESESLLRVDIPKHLFFETFSKSLGSDLIISRLYPENLEISLDSVVSKELEVKPNVDVSFKNKFNSYGQAFTRPQTVMITGLKSQLDTINAVSTEYQRYDDLSQTTERLASLSKIDGVEFSERNVKVVIPVKEFTESEMQVDIKVRGAPDNKSIITFPAKATVKFKASVDDIASIKAADIDAYVNYSQLGSVKSVPVNLDVHNERLRNLELGTPYINYMIKEK
ncbi:MAG: hypothetical protein ACK5IQ_10420 [Bacteroidales bacterium]